MGGVGIEPTQQLWHRIYSPARLSYSGAPPPIGEFRGGRLHVIERLRLSNLELGVLLSADGDGVPPLYLARRNEPSATVLDQHEEEVEAARIELFDHTVPALVASRSRELYGKVIGGIVRAARGLDLDTNQPPPEVGDQVVVRTVEKRLGDARRNPSQPLDCYRFSQISLSSRVESSAHAANIRSCAQQLAGAETKA